MQLSLLQYTEDKLLEIEVSHSLRLVCEPEREPHLWNFPNFFASQNSRSRAANNSYLGVTFSDVFDDLLRETITQ